MGIHLCYLLFPLRNWLLCFHLLCHGWHLGVGHSDFLHYWKVIYKIYEKTDIYLLVMTLSSN